MPDEFRALFWDIDLARFDPEAHPEYTIFRVLEHGDTDACRWLRRAFTREQICRVVREEARLTPKSANFWALVYGIAEDEVAALRRSRSAA